MNLKGKFYHADITKPLPFTSNSFDTVFSCGVFEYFTDETIRSILREAFRVSSKQVIIMVPNAASVAYRIGKWYLEKTRKWQWGGEVPSYSLKPYFRSVGSMRTFEYSVAAKLSLNFLSEIPGGKTIQKICTKVFLLQDHPFPARMRQGYLLITVGEKEQ
jgi:ubiquinone/menaquinone biosynthesis C-methylase UbiE